MVARKWLGLTLAMSACRGEGTPAVPTPAPTATPSAQPVTSAQPKPEPTEAEIKALLAEWGEFMPGAISHEDYLAADAEERWFFLTCKPFVKPLMVAARAAGEKGAGMEQLIPRFVREYRSGELDAPTVKRCATFMIRGVHAYLYSSRMVEARVSLDAIAHSMKERFIENAKLCPSAAPAPTKWDATKKRFLVVAKEFESAGWKCLHFTPASAETRFQLEVKVDATAGTFVASARGNVRDDDGPEQRFELSGKVENGELTYGDVSGPSGKDLASVEPVDLDPP
jgi:hypothetical protein